MGSWPVWSQAAQQDVSSGWAWEVSCLFTVAGPHCSRHCLSSASCQISGNIRFSQEHEPYYELHCTCSLWESNSWWSEGNWGGNAGPGEWLQIQVIVSREVWLHRNHNKLSACRLISKPDQWAASDNCIILSYILQCNNSRNKVHNKHTLLWMIPKTPLAPWSMEKLSSTKPVPKRFGTIALVHLFLLWSLLFLSFYQLGVLFVFIFVVLSGVTLGYLFETYFVSWGRLLLL